MWSVQATENGVFGRVEMPCPRVDADGDILVKMKYACIGRIDAASLYGNLSLVKRKPYVIGSEGSGTIVELNDSARDAGFSLGQSVSGICVQPCGSCAQCRKGLISLCDNPHQKGILSEYVCFRIPQTEALPEALPLETGALLSSVNRAMYLLERAQVSPGGSLLILGCNGIAQICAMLARLYGLSAVAMIGSNERLCELALRNGADFAAFSSSQEGRARISRLVSYQGYDAVIDTWVNPDVSCFGLENLAKRGRYIVASIAVDDINISSTELCWKELSIVGCHEPLMIHPSLKYMMPKLSLGCILGERFSLEHLDTAFQAVVADECMRALIELE